MVVGPHVASLRESNERRALLTELIDSWQGVARRCQSYLVEALDRLVVGQQLSAQAIEVGQTSTKFERLVSRMWRSFVSQLI